MGLVDCSTWVMSLLFYHILRWSSVYISMNFFRIGIILLLLVMLKQFISSYISKIREGKVFSPYLSLMMGLAGILWIFLVKLVKKNLSYKKSAMYSSMATCGVLALIGVVMYLLGYTIPIIYGVMLLSIIISDYGKTIHIIENYKTRLKMRSIKW